MPASARDAGDAERVTTTPAREFGVAWSPDSRKLFYVSDRDGAASLVAYDLAGRRETVLTVTPDELGAPVVSPDGKIVAYVHGRSELRTIVVDSKQVTTAAKGELRRRLRDEPAGGVVA